MLRQIKISQNLSPFSRRVGAKCLLPRSFWQIQAFPCRVICTDLITQEEKTIDFAIDGPVSNFLLVQNLEKGFVEISGFSKKGYFRYQIEAKNNQIILQMKKAFAKEISYCLGKKKGFLQVRQELILAKEKKTNKPTLKEKLYLGVDKKLDLDRIKRGMDLREILPLWFYLGQTIPEIEEKKIKSSIFQKIEEMIKKKDKLHFEKEFLKLFQAGFFDFFIPRNIDFDFQGIFENNRVLDPKDSPFLLLTKVAKLTESLFFQQKENHLEILPSLPNCFHCGRLTNIVVGSLGVLHMQWSKKKITRLILHAKKDVQITLGLSSSIKQYRLKVSKKDRGEIFSRNEQISIKANKSYYFDCFTK